MYELADARLAGAGFDWYEISNWARPGHRGRHNLAYWRRRPYEAVGPGAHAYDGVTRRWNAARLDAYLAALLPAAGRVARLPPGDSERIDRATALAETAVLALRTSEGWSPTGDNGSTMTWADERLAEPLAAGLLERAVDGGLLLTRRGRLLSNEVFARLV
jgi:oxygen-independent coproporphyrinogen-3 oxidase